MTDNTVIFLQWAVNVYRSWSET